MAGGLEPAHTTLSLAGRLMSILGIDGIKEQDRREAMPQAMVEFRKKFGDF